MKRILYLIFFLLLMVVHVMAQDSYRLSGKVLDEQGNHMPGCHVHIDSLCSISDQDGNYSFEALPAGEHTILASYVGFADFTKTLELSGDKKFTVRMVTEASQLSEFVVEEDFTSMRIKRQTVSMEIVDETFTRQNLGGSLMKSLDKLPGISTIDIGSGQSKPLIRGLGFNRVVVAESGIKHQSQQWGTDHGLEMDAFNVSEVEVLKGPASLAYGSDAIGGVIHVIPFTKPLDEGISGEFTLHGKSVNNQTGGSGLIQNRKGKKWYSLRFTALSNGDYKVPTDQITYNTFDFDLRNGYLRNTAGREVNLFGMTGFQSKWGKHKIGIGNYFNRGGFYADAHGLEIRNSKIDFDQSNFDIDLPYQQVNHFKVLSNSTLRVGDDLLKVDLAYQNNFRQEFAEPTAHGYRPAPPDSLEREFRKDIFSANAVNSLKTDKNIQLQYGLNTEWQVNRIGGWGFIIPAFDQMTVGAFAIASVNVSDDLLFVGGLRYDYGWIDIKNYNDWFLSPADIGQNSLVYRERAASVSRNFNDVSGSVGLSYTIENWLMKINLGKSFRMPDARELGADGVNYHMFRQEQGDATLDSEVAYQMDLTVGFDVEKTSFSISPFYSYFPNFIYLNPTSEFNQETGLQQFNYVQNEVRRFGVEASVIQEFLKVFEGAAHFEYINSEQLSGDKKGFGLAFSPPTSALFNLSWKPEIKKSNFSDFYLGIDLKIAADQNRIVPPEEPTEGYQIVNINSGTKYSLNGRQLSMYFQIRNLFNQKYFNHTSFYRLINVPAPGRNFQVTLVINLNQK